MGGGIPIISSLTKSLAANEIEEIVGIINGTTNYILTRMDESGLGFRKPWRKHSQRVLQRLIQLQTLRERMLPTNLPFLHM